MQPFYIEFIRPITTVFSCFDVCYIQLQASTLFLLLLTIRLSIIRSSVSVRRSKGRSFVPTWSPTVIKSHYVSLNQPRCRHFQGSDEDLGWTAEESAPSSATWEAEAPGHQGGQGEKPRITKPAEIEVEIDQYQDRLDGARVDVTSRRIHDDRWADAGERTWIRRGTFRDMQRDIQRDTQRERQQEIRAAISWNLSRHVAETKKNREKIKRGCQKLIPSAALSQGQSCVVVGALFRPN